MMYIAPAFTDQFHGFKRAEFKFAVIPILSLILYKQPSCIFITKEVADSEKELKIQLQQKEQVFPKA